MPRSLPRPTDRGRLARGVVAAWFVGVFLATIWPLQVPAARVRPFVLGLPFALFFLVALIAASFLVLLALYLWEGRGASGDGAGREGA